MSYLAHVTLIGGNISRSERADVSTGAVTTAAALIEASLDKAAPVQMTGDRVGYALHVERFGGSILCHVFGLSADRTTLQVIAAFGVTPRRTIGKALLRRLGERLRVSIPGAPDPKMPQAPWCAVVLLPDAVDHAYAVDWLPQLEVEVAWAWMERPR